MNFFSTTQVANELSRLDSLIRKILNSFEIHNEVGDVGRLYSLVEVLDLLFLNVATVRVRDYRVIHL